MALKEQQFKFGEMVNRLLSWLLANGYSYRFGDAWRSTDSLLVPGTDIKISYQELLVANGKSKVKYGKHNDRLAIDLLIAKDGVDLKDDEYRPIGEYWESVGGIWGGRFGVKKEDYGKKVGGDANHFEL